MKILLKDVFLPIWTFEGIPIFLFKDRKRDNTVYVYVPFTVERDHWSYYQLEKLSKNFRELDLFLVKCRRDVITIVNQCGGQRFLPKEIIEIKMYPESYRPNYWPYNM